MNCRNLSTSINRISIIISNLIFFLFFLLSIRFVLIYLNYLSGIVQIAGLSAVIITITLTWWKPVKVLFLFAAFIPLISGIQEIGVLKFAPILSFGFSVIYISWFLKKIISEEKSFETNNLVSAFIDTLAGIVCLSIIAGFCYYPLNFSIYRLQFASIMGQADPFWFMEAGFIILQGLFLYRIIEIEIKVIKDFRPFTICLYFHAVTIVIFSIAQLIFGIPEKGYGDTIFSPFQDVHSYSGYLIIIFFFLSWLTFHKKIYIFELILSFSMLTFIYLSGSTSSMISLIIVGFISYFIISFGKRKNIVFPISIFLGLVIVVSCVIKFTPDNYVTSKYAAKLKSLSTVSQNGPVFERFQFWRQAIAIIDEFPVTGSGVGSFYKISNNYHFNKALQPGQHENAHNYYLQFAAEVGVPALFLFFLILFFIYKKGLQPKNSPQVQGLLLGLSAYLISMMSGHHLILSSQQLLFWFILSAISFTGNTDFPIANAKIKQRNLQTFLFGLILLIIACHVINLFYLQKEIKGLNEYGLYKSQVVNNNKMRWTMKYSGQELFAESDEFGFSMYAEPENLNSGILKMCIYVNDKLVDQVVWNNKGTILRNYNIPGIKGRTISIRTNSSDSYNPYTKGLSKNIRENRDQSVALSDIVFKI